MGKTIIFLFIIILQITLSQEEPTPTVWKSFISVGYTGAVPNTVRDYYNSVVDSYRSKGIPIPTQRTFGTTAVLHGGILISQMEHLWIGCSAGYSYSPAFSNYKDFAGTLKINGTVNTYAVSLKIVATAATIGELPIKLTLQPGLSYVSLSINRDLKYTDGSNGYEQWKWSASSWGECLQATIGTSMPLGDFVIAVDGGYSGGLNMIGTETIESNSGNKSLPGFGDIGYSGFIALLTLEIKI